MTETPAEALKAGKHLPGMNPLPSLLRAIVYDVANEQMRKGGRSKWSRADYDAGIDKFDRMVAACYGDGVEGRVRFGYAEEMQKAGLLTLYTKDFYGTFNAAFAAYEALFGRVAA